MNPDDLPALVTKYQQALADANFAQFSAQVKLASAEEQITRLKMENAALKDALQPTQEVTEAEQD